MTDDYEETILRMVRAATLHFQSSGGQPMLFEDLEEKMSELARRDGHEVTGERPGIIASLEHVIDEWALNDAARAFCQVLLEASDGRATYMQARAVLHRLRLVQAYPVLPSSGTIH